MPGPVVLDNTVLSNLAVVQRTDLLTLIWSDLVITTKEVLAEYQEGVARGLVAAEAWVELPAVTLSLEEQALSQSFAPRLGPGERSCLAVALQRIGLFVSDDADARSAAGKLGVPVTGTLGVLAVAVVRGHLTLDDANALLSRMITAGYRSPVLSLDSLVETHSAP